MRFAVLLAALLVGCDTTGVPERADLRTDADHYAATDDGRWIGFEVPLTFRNTTGATVLLSGCARPDPPALEKRVGGAWVPAYHAVVTLCLAAPVPIRPGETFAYTFRAAAAWPGMNAAPEWRVGNVDGEYRVRWRASTEGGGLDLVSNPFRLTVE